MSHINDAIVDALGPGHINDLLLGYYQSNGATSPNISDAAYEFLVVQGATPAHINDMWFLWLRDLGYTGALNDMLKDFWEGGGAAGGRPPIDLINSIYSWSNIMTEDGKSYVDQANRALTGDYPQGPGIYADFDGVMYGEFETPITLTGDFTFTSEITVTSDATNRTLLGGTDTNEGIVRIRSSFQPEVYIGGKQELFTGITLLADTPYISTVTRSGVSLTYTLVDASGNTQTETIENCSTDDLTLRYIGKYATVYSPFIGGACNYHLEDSTGVVFSNFLAQDSTQALCVSQVGPDVTWHNATGSPYGSSLEFGHVWENYSEAENYALFSEDKSNDLEWVSGYLTKIESGVDPFGSPAYKLQEDTSTNIHSIQQFVSSTWVVGDRYTIDVCLKADGRDGVVIRFGRGYDYITFNLITGDYSAKNSATLEATDVGDGWWRCIVTCPVQGDGSQANYLNFKLYSYEEGSAAYTGDGTSGILIGRVQLSKENSGAAYALTTDKWVVGKIPQDLNTPTQDVFGNTLTNPGTGRQDMRVNGFTGTWDGTAYLTNAGITGSETVVSQVGDSVVSFATGRINFTAGTCSYLELSNGDEIILESSNTSLQTSVWDDGNEYALNDATRPFFTTEKEGSRLLAGGYTKDAVYGDELWDSSQASLAEGWSYDGDDTFTRIGVGSVTPLTMPISLPPGTLVSVTIDKLANISSNIRVWVQGDSYTLFSADLGVQQVFCTTVGDSGIINFRPLGSDYAGTFKILEIKKYAEGYVPARADGLSALGQPLTNQPGQIDADSPVLLYVPETVDFYNLATYNSVDTQLYLAQVAIGQTPLEWETMINVNLNDSMFNNYDKQYWSSGWNPALTGWDLEDTKEYYIDGYVPIDPYELIVNGDFSDGDTGWSFGGSCWTVADGKATCDGSASGNLSQNALAFEEGKTYRIEVTTANGVYADAVYVRPNSQSLVSGAITEDGAHSFDWPYDGIEGAFIIRNVSTGFTGDVTHVSVKEINPPSGWTPPGGEDGWTPPGGEDGWNPPGS